MVKKEINVSGVYYPNSNQLVKNIPTDSNSYVFIDWLKEKNAYQNFLKYCDLSILLQEKDPYQFFCCLNWDLLSSIDKEDEFEFLIDHWFDFLENKTLENISSGVESSKELEEKIFFKEFLQKIETFDFSKVSLSRAKEILKLLN